MKSKNKLWLAVLLTVLVASLLAVGFTAAAEETPAYALNDHIQFGSYPQSRAEETEALQAAAQAATWKSYGYYSGTGDLTDGQMQPGDWMQFADFCCGGEKYRAVQFSQYRPIYTGDVSGAETSNQDDQGYFTDTVYYFKYEPLTWRILDPAAGLILCENVIDAQAFQNTIYGLYNGLDSDTYAVDYPASSIRAWLNLDFYQTAFTPAQKAKIQTTYIETKSPSDSEYDPEAYDAAPTNDRIFLLSSWDVDTRQYGFLRGGCESDDTKIAQGTDYARCQGLREGNFRSPDPATGIYQDNMNAYWRLRSAYSYSDLTAVDDTGENNCGHKANDSRYGIRPACRLSALGDDTEQSEYLYSTVVDNGFCGGEDDGTNLVWALDNDGTLTISGKGAMADYTSASDAPWYSVSASIQSVVVEEGVTSIGTGAFYSGNFGDYAGTLMYVTIPKSVAQIGERAFGLCCSLQRFTVDADNACYASDDSGCLFNKDKTTLIQYPAGNPRTSFTIPDGVTTIGDWAFDDCLSLASVAMPNSVTHIGNCAFAYCGSLTNITLSKSLTTIGYHAFGECSITSIRIPDGVTSVGTNLFFCCNELKTVSLPASLTSIGGGTFFNCGALTDVFYGGSKAQWTAVFESKNDPVENATVHYNVVDWGYCGGEGDGTNLVWVLDNDGTLTIFGTGALADFAGSDTPWYAVKDDVQAIVVEEGVTDIRSITFSDYPALTAVEISDSVTLGGTLFSGCSNLVSVRLSNHARCIYSSAFYNCSSLTSVNVPADAKSIDLHAFYGCSSLRSIEVPEGVTCLGFNSFEGCSSLTEIMLPASLTHILWSAFKDCGALTNVFYAGSEEQWNQIVSYDYHGPTITGDGITLNDDLLNAHIHYNATGHTPGEAVRENEIPATCTEAGSYDAVVSCTQCDYEFSREHITVDPTGHQNTVTWEKVLPRPGFREHGHEAGVWCNDCNAPVSGCEDIHNQDGPQRNEIPATVDAPGSVEIQCTKCGGWGLYELPQLEQPETPDQPTQPDQPSQPEQPSGNNGGNSGSSFGERIRQFANSIINVFLRLIRWLGGKK